MLVRDIVAIISALLSLISQQLGSLVRAILGWSVTALFGRLSTVKQTALAAMLIVSLVWPVLVVGIFVPGVAAWGFAFVPLQKWWGVVPVRILSIILSAVLPPIVGLVTFHLVPAHNRKGGLLRAALGGYPLTLGFAISCLLTAVIVPIVKVSSAIRRWEDEHTFVQPREGEYRLALEEIRHACRDSGVETRVEEVPWRLSLPTRVLKALARSAVDALIAEDPKMLRGRGIEVYLYPADLLVRGEKKRVARLRACLTRTMLEQHAYLTSDPAAQRIEDDVRGIWGILDRHASADEIGDIGRQRLAEVEHELDTKNVPFEDWLILDRAVQQLQLELGGGTRIPLPASDTREDDDLRRQRAHVGRARAMQTH